jgi:chromosome segregation ATPase
MQRAKAKAAQDQAVLAEKAATAAAKKVKQLEAEMDELREKHRKTPEAALVQQIAELKGQLADCERRIEAVKAEKSQILQDKEKFRVNVKKLVRPLCRTMLEE